MLEIPQSLLKNEEKIKEDSNPIGRILRIKDQIRLAQLREYCYEFILGVKDGDPETISLAEMRKIVINLEASAKIEDYPLVDEINDTLLEARQLGAIPWPKPKTANPPSIQIPPRKR